MKILKKVLGIINREVPIETLKKRGMKVGKNFSKQQGCFIDPSHCFLIEIGDNVTFSIRVTLLAHDASSKKIIDYTKFGKIIIHDNVFIGANVTILPNIEIGEGAIVGAGSVVTKNIPSNMVFAGNPAKPICTVEEYKQKLLKLKNDNNSFSDEYTMRKKINYEKKKELIEYSKINGIGFIE